ncbi:hypothetical protein Ahia01_000285900 [Argonauta hians]
MLFSDKEGVCKGIQEIFTNPKCSVAEKSIPVNYGYTPDSHQKTSVRKSPSIHSQALNESFHTSQNQRKCSVPKDIMTTASSVKAQQAERKPNRQVEILKQKSTKHETNNLQKRTTNVPEEPQLSKNANKGPRSPSRSKDKSISERKTQELRKKDEIKEPVIILNTCPTSYCSKTEITNSNQDRSRRSSSAKNQPVKAHEKCPPRRSSTRLNAKDQNVSQQVEKDTSSKSPTGDSPRKLRSRTRDTHIPINQESNLDFVTGSKPKDTSCTNKEMSSPMSKTDRKLSKLNPKSSSTPLLDNSNNSYKAKEEIKTIHNRRDDPTLTTQERTKDDLNKTQSKSQCVDRKSQASKSTSNKTRLRSIDQLNLLSEKFPPENDTQSKKKTKNTSICADLQLSKVSILTSQGLTSIKETQQDGSYVEEVLVIPESMPTKQLAITSGQLNNTSKAINDTTTTTTTEQQLTNDSGIASLSCEAPKHKTTEKSPIKLISPVKKAFDNTNNRSNIYQSLIKKNSELKTCGIEQIKKMNSSVLKDLTKVLSESKQCSVDNKSHDLDKSKSLEKSKNPVKGASFHFTSSDSDDINSNTKTNTTKFCSMTEENLKKFNQQRENTSSNNLKARIKGFVQSSYETAFENIDNDQLQKEEEILKCSSSNTLKNLDKDLVNDKNIDIVSDMSEMNVPDNSDCGDDNNTNNNFDVQANADLLKPKSPEHRAERQNIDRQEKKTAESPKNQHAVESKTTDNCSKSKPNQSLKRQKTVRQKSSSCMSPNTNDSDKKSSDSPSFKLFEPTPIKSKPKRTSKFKKLSDSHKGYDPYDFESASDFSSNFGKHKDSPLSEKRKFFKSRSKIKPKDLTSYLEISTKPKLQKKNQRQSSNKGSRTKQTEKPDANQSSKSKSILEESHKDSHSETHVPHNYQQHDSFKKDKETNKGSDICTRNTRKRKAVNYKELDTSYEEEINDASVASNQSSVTTPQKKPKSNTTPYVPSEPNLSPISSHNSPIALKQFFNPRQKPEPRSKSSNQTGVSAPQKKPKSNTTPQEPRKQSLSPSSLLHSSILLKPSFKPNSKPNNQSVASSKSGVTAPYEPREQSLSPSSSHHSYISLKQSCYPKQKTQQHSSATNRSVASSKSGVTVPYEPKEPSLSPSSSHYSYISLKQSYYPRKKSQRPSNATNKALASSISESQIGSSITQNSEVSWVAAKKYNYPQQELKKTYSSKKDISYFGSYPCIPKIFKNKPKNAPKKHKEKSKNHKDLDKDMTYDDILLAHASSLSFLTDDDHNVVTRRTTELSHAGNIGKSQVAFNISENFLPTENVFEIHQFQSSQSSSFPARTKTSNNLQATQSDSSVCASRVSHISNISFKSHTSTSSKKIRFPFESEDIDSPLLEETISQEQHYHIGFHSKLPGCQEIQYKNAVLNAPLSTPSCSSKSSSSSQSSKEQKSLTLPAPPSFWKPNLSTNFPESRAPLANNLRALPTSKAVKKAVSLSVQDEPVELSRSDRRSDTSSYRHSNIKDSYISYENNSCSIESGQRSGSIKNLVQCLGADMKRSIAKKQANISAITKETLTNTEKSLLKIWHKDSSNRSDAFCKFEKKLLKEFERLHNEIISSDDDRNKLMYVLQEQVEKSENSRSSQLKIINRIQSLYSYYHSAIRSDHEVGRERKAEVQNILQTEMTELQKKFLLEANQQEMQQIRSRLYKILT